MVETVGHANGDLDAVVGCLEPRVGASEPDGPENAGPASPDLLRGFDDPGIRLRDARNIQRLSSPRLVRPDA